MKRQPGSDLTIEPAAVEELARRMERALEEAADAETRARWTDAYVASGGGKQPPSTRQR